MRKIKAVLLLLIVLMYCVPFTVSSYAADNFNHEHDIETKQDDEISKAVLSYTLQNIKNFEEQQKILQWL